MIDFENVWLPQIVSYARLISSGQLEAEWLGQAASATSVTDPDELYEQVFDDLDADGIWADQRDCNALSADGRQAIECFLQALRSIEEADACLLVKSSHWRSVQQAAEAVIADVSSPRCWRLT
jgi:hypothetical protein